MADDTSVRIREAAIDLFAQQGFAATGIRQLADRVGVTTSTLYHHVRGKDELLDTIIATLMRAMNAIADHWETDGGRPDDKLAGLIASHVVIHANAPAEVLVVDRQLAAMSAESRAVAVTERSLYEQTWQRQVAAVVDGGSLPTADPRLATRALLGACTAVADWFSATGRLSAVEVADQYVAMSFRLLGSPTVPTTPCLDPALHIFDSRWDTP